MYRKSKKNQKLNKLFFKKPENTNPDRIIPKMPLATQTSQDSVPIYAVHENDNMIEAYPGCYSRTYAIDEINFQSSSTDEKEAIMESYRRFLNTYGPTYEVSLTIFNRDINLDQFREETLIKETGDKFDYLRNQMNQILINRICEGNNGLKKDKFLTVAMHLNGYKKASETFTKRYDDNLNTSFKLFMSGAKPLSIEDRLEVIHDIYNMGSQTQFLSKNKVVVENGKVEEISSFDMENIRSQGLSVNDVIAPSSMQIKKDHIILGNQYARVLHIPIDGYPTGITNEFFTLITNMPFNMIATLNMRPLSKEHANKLISENIMLVRQQKAKLQRKARNDNYSEEMIDPAIIEREQDCLAMRDLVRNKNEALFETTFTFIIFAENLQKLDEYTDFFISEAKGEGATILKFNYMQEEGFNATLPLGINPLWVRRTLNSSSVAVLVPFSNLEINEKSGINYTMNAISKNLIVYDRTTKPNYNGFIIGSSGAGKSFAAKTEIVNVFLGTNSDIIIIDPEREYISLAEAFDGQVIELKPGGTTFINPLDIDFSYEMDGENTGNPVLEKSSFIMKLFESMLNEVWGMDSVQKTLIDECLLELYAPFLDENGNLIKAIPTEETPTLNDMMDVFAKMKEPEARKLWFTLKRYAGRGTLNIFSHHTNVKLKNRLIVFDISAVGDELKLLSMNIIQDMMWIRLVENRKIGKFTYFYVDECHIFFTKGNESAADFLCALWKRSRKYGGCPCGLTQNVNDMLDHPVARKMLSECNFIQVFAQKKEEREKLKQLLHLSDHLMEYITNIVQGQGLFYTGQNTVPFFSQFPKDNDIYPILTSDATEILEYKERKNREEMKKKKAEKQAMYT